MEKAFRILVAENDDMLAKTAKEFLESRGYTVFMANTPEKAKDFLENNWVHLAVVDMRLRDDDSEIDKSGIDLLKSTARQVPKLIWTAYTKEYQDVRAAMKRDDHLLPPAVDFVAKQEGLRRLGEAVSEALAEYMPLNKTMRVAWRSFLSFPQLTEMVMGDYGRLPRNDLVLELEDLFCLLFGGQPGLEIAQITIGKVIIAGNGYVILGIHAFRADGTEIPYVVNFGEPEIVKQEARLFETAVPRPIKTSNLFKSREVATTHFAATAYRLVEGHLDTIAPFSRFYRQNEMTTIVKGLDNLFGGNLVQWYRQGRQAKSLADIDAFYAGMFRQAKSDLYLNWFQQTVAQICKKMPAVGFGEAKIDEEHLQLPTLVDNASPLPAPLNLLKKSFTLPDVAQWGRIHGKVGPKTILVDHLAHTWLIDFSQVSQGPLLHDFTHLETQIKMHLLERHSLTALFQFERQLLGEISEDPHLSPSLNKGLKLINALRHHALQMANCTPDLYHAVLYYQGLNHLLQFDERRFYTQAELQPFLHLLISVSLISSLFLSRKTAASGLIINEEKRQVYVNGEPVSNLSTREYKLLLYFKMHEGQTRSRQEIVLEGFEDERYDEFTDRDRVNNAIKRLREKIEPELPKHRFIVTIPGQGYQFNSSVIDK